MRVLPKGAILIHSTTSPVWPYFPFIFKKLTWPIIDLMLLLPMLTITSGNDMLGRGYKSKSINIHYLPADPDRKTSTEFTMAKGFEHSQGVETSRGFSRANSSFFKEDFPKLKKGAVIECTNTLLKDPSQIKYLE